MALNDSYNNSYIDTGTYYYYYYNNSDMYPDIMGAVPYMLQEFLAIIIILIYYYNNNNNIIDDRYNVAQLLL